MIVKFDHISYSCALSQENNIRNLFSGYEVQFHEIGLENLSMKRAYMRDVQEEHNIMLLQKKGSYPIEITAYQTCHSRTSGIEDKYVLMDDCILIYSENPEATVMFFELLGMKKGEDSVLELKPLLDEKTVRIQVCKAEECAQVYLDDEGFGSLAFVVDNAKKQRQLLKDNNIKCSEVEELVVNGKELKIFFTKSSAGEIIEFIGLR